MVSTTLVLHGRLVVKEVFYQVLPLFNLRVQGYFGPNKKSYLKESIKKKKVLSIHVRKEKKRTRGRNLREKEKKQFYPFTLQKKKKKRREGEFQEEKKAILSIHVRKKKKNKKDIRKTQKIPMLFILGSVELDFNKTQTSLSLSLSLNFAHPTLLLKRVHSNLRAFLISKYLFAVCEITRNLSSKSYSFLKIFKSLGWVLCLVAKKIQEKLGIFFSFIQFFN